VKVSVQAFANAFVNFFLGHSMVSKANSGRVPEKA
jgi:hypothetical protein